MRRSIATITDTISTVFGISPSGRIVTGLATLRLRTLYLARPLWMRPARVPVRVHVANPSRVAPERF
ncbi:MAG: hypothetical protein A2V70_17345 [Planctomycetes bacterium RBG_13_63_9]|nr:MAG: hypothetical protein A2V70_17345 [Planctomycetes bacterium RBG_13_63_9]